MEKKLGKKQNGQVSSQIISPEIIQNKIYLVRGEKVMMDKDLAILYGVSTRRLKEQVRRNLKRFPSDFLIELKIREAKGLFSRSQFATLKKGQNIKFKVFAFTEQGVAMLSSVLHSNRAIEVNIQIMRAFVKLRELMITHKDLARKIEALENKFKECDEKFVLVFKAIKQLLTTSEDQKKKLPIGFQPVK